MLLGLIAAAGLMLLLIVLFGVGTLVEAFGR